MQFDLVLLSLGGVQRFIGEARSTADVAGASEIVQQWAKLAAATVEQRLAGQREPCGLIFPAATSSHSVSNKIVFLAPAGTGPTVARAVTEDIGKRWRDQLKAVFKTGQPPGTPGLPDLSWVSVTGPVTTEGEYRALWKAAQREMAGRRRARVFEPVEIPRTILCAQSPGLPAVTAPRGSPPHERAEALSGAGWAKRRVGQQRRRADHQPFPSTVSIASSVFRSELLERATADPDLAATLRDPVAKLTAAVQQLGLSTDRAELRTPSPSPPGLEALAGPLGAWISPERWDVETIEQEYRTRPDNQTVRTARQAAGRLRTVARQAGVDAPSPYYAIVVQDLDKLGRGLDGFGLDQQREVSRLLSELAAEQATLLHDQHPRAVLVYAGGDDLLAFCPAGDALGLAESLRRQIAAFTSTGPLATAGPGRGPITASTGVAFAHMASPLQDAIQAARAAIDAAKHQARRGGRSRDALGVVVRRRGGERARTVQPWWPVPPDGASAAQLLTRIRPDPRADALSAVLGSDLERDQATLSELAEADRTLLRAELIRLVRRHGGTPQAGDALCTLGLSERGAPGRFEPVPAALVARFLTQEAHSQEVR